MKRLLASRELLLLAAIGVLLAVIASRFPAFVAPSNLVVVFNDTSPLILLAIGQMIVILTKCIDLSVAANLALTGMVVSLINIAAPGLPIFAIVVIAIGFGTLLGMFNGILVWKLAIPPIVVTLGTMTIFRGIIFLLTAGKWVNSHEMSDAFKAVPRTVVLGLPILSWIAVAAVILFAVAAAHLGPTPTAGFSASVPATAALLAIPVLGELPGPLEWVGIGTVSAGLALLMIRGSKG